LHSFHKVVSPDQEFLKLFIGDFVFYEQFEYGRGDVGHFLVKFEDVCRVEIVDCDHAVIHAVIKSTSFPYSSTAEGRVQDYSY